jgi:acyl carrier protein
MKPSQAELTAAESHISEILATVTSLLQQVVGEDLQLMGPIDYQTSFSDDLELESIEFVALAEKIQQQYGERLDFVGWISQKELDELIHLTVGELVEFIAASSERN